MYKGNYYSEFVSGAVASASMAIVGGATSAAEHLNENALFGSTDSR